jgi:hypothetical protein
VTRTRFASRHESLDESRGLLKGVTMRQMTNSEGSLRIANEFQGELGRFRAAQRLLARRLTNTGNQLAAADSFRSGPTSCP